MPINTAPEGVHSDQDADELRDAMVDAVIVRRERLGLVPPREVEAAMRTVPRHLFAPGVALDKAYSNDSIVTKRNECGVGISAISAPSIIAMMLGQLQVRPGQRVLEIGSGGYNAALLQELAGPDGSVTTIDIDEEIADRARVCLATTGYRDVRVLCGDGEFGAAEYGPFDRIIVTVGTWDIPPAWVEQLAEGGRLVVPLRTKGLYRSWALERAGGYLAGRDPMTCGFVPMQGLGEHRGRSIPLHGDEVSLRLDARQQVDTATLEEVLSTPRAQAWSGVTIRKGENFSDLDLWLARLPDFCILSSSRDAVNRGLVSPDWHVVCLALVDQGSSLAYLAKLRLANAGETARELGVYAHGPDAVKVADRFMEQIRIWDRDHRHGPGPRLTVHPANTPDAELPSGLVADRRHTRIVIFWPDHDE